MVPLRKTCGGGQQAYRRRFTLYLSRRKQVTTFCGIPSSISEPVADCHTAPVLRQVHIAHIPWLRKCGRAGGYHHAHQSSLIIRFQCSLSISHQLPRCTRSYLTT
ncbi:hypothetical protein VTI74DRAFT_4790 [Chaetomium olivicolor]